MSLIIFSVLFVSLYSICIPMFKGNKKIALKRYDIFISMYIALVVATIVISYFTTDIEEFLIYLRKSTNQYITIFFLLTCRLIIKSKNGKTN